MARYLIIAASSAIGQATTTLLRNAGHEVITTARDRIRINADHIVDARDFDAVEALFAKVGAIDGVVNCAGSLWLKPAHMTGQEQFQATIDASLTTAFATVRAAGKHMTQGGSVVLITSAAAVAGLHNHEAISAAKAGVIGLMLAAAATYSGRNLRVNAVAPGLVETPLTAHLTSNDLSRKASEAMHALGRLGKPEDIAHAIVFLLEPHNDWITGQVMGVDGGLGHILPRLKL